MTKLSLIIPFLLTLIVLTTTFSLKLISYDKVPAPGITFDEYAFAWMGRSFLQTGSPVSWTTNLAAYQKSFSWGKVFGWGLTTDQPNSKKPIIASLTFDYGLGDRHIDLVQPYLDHPPLAGVVYSLGIPHKLPTLTDVTPADFRKINATLAVATAALLFILGLLLYSPWVGFLAALLYSTIPTTLFFSRLTLAENVLIPFFLSSMICLHLGLRRKQLWLLVASGLLAGACTLTKFSGASAALAGLLILFFSKSNRSYYLSFILSFLAPTIFYLVYANALSADLFWRVLFNQSSRGNWGVINLIQSIARINFSGFPIDGWWTGGLVCLFYLIAGKKHQSLTAMSLAYLLVATLLGGDNNAWYFFPLGIFACLAWGVVITEIVQTPSLVNLSIFFLFGILSSFYWGYLRLNLQTNFSWPIRIAAVVMLGSSLLLPGLLAKHRLVKILWVLFMAFVIHRLYLWNVRGFLYLLSQWGQLPPPLMLPPSPI